MKGTPFLCLLILFLSVSHIFSAAAVPTTRSLKTFQKDSQFHELLAQGEVEMRNTNSEELLEFEQGYIEGRMDIESNDYPGTGANNHHDPKTPGRA